MIIGTPTFLLLWNKIRQFYVFYFALSSTGKPNRHPYLPYIHTGSLAWVLYIRNSISNETRNQEKVENGKTFSFVELPLRSKFKIFFTECWLTIPNWLNAAVQRTLTKSMPSSFWTGL